MAHRGLIEGAGESGHRIGLFIQRNDSRSTSAGEFGAKLPYEQPCLDDLACLRAMHAGLSVHAQFTDSCGCDAGNPAADDQDALILESRRSSITLRRPIARASRAAGAAAPGPAAGGGGEFAHARGILILNRHRSANRTGFCDVTSKSHEIGMRDDSIGDVDREIIALIARASLRDEDQVPGTVVSRARVCYRCKANEAARCRDQTPTFHHVSSPSRSRQTMGLSRRAAGRHRLGARPVAGQSYGAFG